MLRSDHVIDYFENFMAKTQKNFPAKIHEQLMILIELQATQHGIHIKITNLHKTNLLIETPFEISKISQVFLEMRKFYMIKLKRPDILKSAPSPHIVTQRLSSFEQKTQIKR